MLDLTIMGHVEQFVDIVPKRAVLNGVAGSPTKNIAFTIDETKSPEKKEYVLTVENLQKTKGRYVDTIKLKTDSKIRPEIKIYVIGNIIDRPIKEKQ
jgi:hypothetical protein